MKAPYININSDYVQKANKDIKEIYDSIYESYGEKMNGVTKAGELKYEFYVSENILFVVIISREGVTNAGWSKNYIIYNINLETLKEATFEDVYKVCGFKSTAQVEEKAKIAIDNEGSISDIATWNTQTGLYYAKSGEFNIINTVVTLKERDSYGTHGRDGYDYIEGTNIMRAYCTSIEGYCYEIYDELFNYQYYVECTFDGQYKYKEISGEEKIITEEEFNKLAYKNSNFKHLRTVADKNKEDMIKFLENK